ncbi:hypothetical protein BOTBODRAFT_471846 [Botryobasidium botryosum FD-172 SS1]|uniref:Uncharacterized protein n=1 Tax=Botryobasidium botryosum (strain FD-172 SS1) TaxID=930990 RepID=A0A067M5T4_BOTB1|nr:hypothetical protein BOTBODRAFT_471846 [Botryobasidium botryosum FD-172 SS1]
MLDHLHIVLWLYSSPPCASCRSRPPQAELLVHILRVLHLPRDQSQQAENLSVHRHIGLAQVAVHKTCLVETPPPSHVSSGAVLAQGAALPGSTMLSRRQDSSSRSMIPMYHPPGRVPRTRRTSTFLSVSVLNRRARFWLVLGSDGPLGST